MPRCRIERAADVPCMNTMDIHAGPDYITVQIGAGPEFYEVCVTSPVRESEGRLTDERGICKAAAIAAVRHLLSRVKK